MFEIAGEYFVLTAAHVTRPATDFGFAQYIAPRIPKAPLIRLDDAVAHATDPEDPWDLAAVHLPKSTAEKIAEGRKFLRLVQLDHSDGHDKDDILALVGYPEANMVHDTFKRSVRTKPLPYLTVWYGGDRGPIPDSDPGLHLLVEFTRRESVNQSGEEVEVPAPFGISGCGIWRLMNGKSRKNSWTSNEIRLIGIQHSWMRSLNVLKGTKIKYAIEVIYRQRPDLRKAIHISWGDSWRWK